MEHIKAIATVIEYEKDILHKLQSELVKTEVILITDKKSPLYQDFIVKHDDIKMKIEDQKNKVDFLKKIMLEYCNKI